MQLLHELGYIQIIPRVTERPKRPSDNDWEYIYLSSKEYQEWENVGKIVCSTTHMTGRTPFRSGIIHPNYWEEPKEGVLLRVSIFGSKVIELQKMTQIETVFVDFKDMTVLKRRLKKRCVVDNVPFELKWERVQSEKELEIAKDCDFVVWNDGTPEKILEQFLKLL